MYKDTEIKMKWVGNHKININGKVIDVADPKTYYSWKK
jgi:hypothetical protein